MPLNNPLSLSFDRGKTFTLFLFFFFGFSNFRAREWTFPRGKTSYFLGMLLAGDLLTDARNFPLRSVFLCFFFFGTKGDNGIVVGFVWLCNALGRSTPSYFDFSRFKYCTIYILWFVRRGRGKGRNMLYAFYFYLRVFKRPVWISNNASSSSRKGNLGEEPFREREGYKNYGNGAMIEDKGYRRNRWRVESPVKIASKICTIPAPLSRRLDSRTASCDPTRLHRSCNLQILAKVRGRNLFHRSFPSREISTGCFLHVLSISKLLNTRNNPRLIEHSFEIWNSFRIKRKEDHSCGKTMPFNTLIC